MFRVGHLSPPMWTAMSVLFMALSSSVTLVLHRGNFAHRGRLAMFKHILQLPQQGLLLASTGMRPRMQQTILQMYRVGSPYKEGPGSECQQCSG